MKVLLTLAFLLVAPAARADTTADVTAAFSLFVSGVATDKLPAGVELFIGTAPQHQPMPKNIAPTKALVVGAGFKGTKIVVSKGGKSAWLYTEIAKVRASAFLTSDGTAWKVVAAHWSLATPIYKGDMCGDLGDDWQLPASVPKDAVDAVSAIAAAGETAYWKLTSDAKTALMIGSAAKEKVTGGKAIKKKLKKLELSANKDENDAVPARAGVGPDGEMMWVALTVGTMQRCSNYRALLVLAKETAGWRIVHQHYSVPVGDSDEE